MIQTRTSVGGLLQLYDVLPESLEHVLHLVHVKAVVHIGERVCGLAHCGSQRQCGESTLNMVVEFAQFDRVRPILP